MTLWILFCRMTKDVDTLFTFYARDRHHAELKAEEILDWYGYEQVDLKEYRGGFRMAFTYIPGMIEGDTVLETSPRMVYTSRQ
jgi:hypothetical protein